MGRNKTTILATRGTAAKQKLDKLENGEQKSQTLQPNVMSSDSSNSNGSETNESNSKEIPTKSSLQQSILTFEINQRPRRQIKHKYITDRRNTTTEMLIPIQTSSKKDVNLISATSDTTVLPKRKRGRPRTVRPVTINDPQSNSNSSINDTKSTDNTEHSNSSDNILQLVEIIKDDTSANDSSSNQYELVHVVNCSSQSQDLINATNADHPERSVSLTGDGITIEKHSDDTYRVCLDSGKDAKPNKRLNSNDNKIYVDVSESLDSQEIVDVKEVIYDSGSQNSSLFNIGDVYGFEEQQAVPKFFDTNTQPKSFEGAFSGIRKSKRLTSVRIENTTIEEESATNKKASKEDCMEIPVMTATDAVSVAVLQLNQLESSMSTDSSKAYKKSKKIQPIIRSKRIARCNSFATFADAQANFTPSKSPLSQSETPVVSEKLPTLLKTKDFQLDATPVSVATAEITATEQTSELASSDKVKITPPRTSSLKLQAQISTTFDILLKKSRPENGSSTALSKTVGSYSKIISSLENSDICGSPSPSENIDNVAQIAVPSSAVHLKSIVKRLDNSLNIPPFKKIDFCEELDKVAQVAVPRPSSADHLKSIVKRLDNSLNLPPLKKLDFSEELGKVPQIAVSRPSSAVHLKPIVKRLDNSLNLPPIKKIDFSEALDKLEMKDRESISWKRRTDTGREISGKKSKTKSRTIQHPEIDRTLPFEDRNQEPICDSKLLVVSKNTDRKRNKASHIEKALLESGSYDPIETSVVDTQTSCNPQPDVINSEVSVNISAKESNDKNAELALNLLKQLQEPIIPKPIVKTKGSLKALVDPKISIDSHSRDSTRKDKSKRKQAKTESSSKKVPKVKSKKITSHASTDSLTELSGKNNVPVDEASPSQLPEENVRKNTKLKSTRWGKIDTSTEPDTLSLSNFNNGYKLIEVEQNHRSTEQQDETPFLNYTATSESELNVKSIEMLDANNSSTSVLLKNGVNHQFNGDKETHDDIQINEFNENSVSSSMILEDKSSSNGEEGTNIRRSGRIKSISETKQRSHGFGLVKDKERFQNMSTIDSTNANSQDYQYSFYDTSSLNNTLASSDCDRSFFTAIESPIRTKEDIEKDEREVQEGLALFVQTVDSEYKTERNICREAKNMTCDCFLTPTDIANGEFGCGEDCMNRMLMIECSAQCNVGERCTNQRFQKILNASCTIFKTDKKGFGMKAVNYIPAGDFIMEYVGEVLNSQQFEERANAYSLDNNKHHYFMALRSDRVIDATVRGNISRFINHSCDPNAETQKWTVKGELRIGFFSIRNIYPNEEITFDYRLQRYGKEAQKCYCEAEKCRGWIGEDPETDEEYEDIEDEEEAEVNPDVQPFIPEIAEPEQLKGATLVESIETFGTPVATITSIDSILPQTDSILIGNETEIADSDTSAQKSIRQKPKKRAEIMEDPDLDMEIHTLMHTQLKNQAHTLRFSRLMVRAKLKRARSQLLSILRKGELACRRLFLDYHGLKLLYNWMCDEVSENDQMAYLQFRLEILITLEVLPIPNKLMLQDSKVLLTVAEWVTSPSASAADISAKSSPIDTSLDCDKINDATSDKLTNAQYHEALRNMPDLIEQGIDLTALKHIISTNQNNEKKINTMPTVAIETAATEDAVIDERIADLNQQIRSIALKLVTAWKVLPEAFRIPKKMRIKQMKEHEREANLNYSVLGLSEESEKLSQQRYKDRYKKDGSMMKDHEKDRFRTERPTRNRSDTEFSLSKLYRRRMFEAKVAEEERRIEQERMHVFICSYFQLDPKLINEHDVPFFVDPYTGQWHARDGHKVPPPRSHMHVRPPARITSSNLNDYNLPPMDLPEFWKCGVTEQGHLYYYHVKIRIPQWQPPIKILPLTSTLASEATNVARKKPDVVYPRNNSASEDSESSESDDSSELTLYLQISNLYKELTDRKDNPYYILKTPSNLSEEISAMANVLTPSSVDVIKPLDLAATLEGARQLIPQKYMEKRIGLVDVRMMSPRTDKERLEMKEEMRRNKEKVRRRKEEARRKKHALVPSGSSLEPPRKLSKLTEGLPIIPLDEDGEASSIASTANDSLTTMTAMLDEEIAQSGDDDANLSGSIIMKNVDELDILRKSKSLQKTLNVGNHVPTAETSIQIQKRKKTVDAPPTHLNNEDIKRIKDKFRADIIGVIVHHLGPYRKVDCKIGRITSTEDFKHLAKKLTQYVMQKELKYCGNTDALEVTESVKIKSKEFIKKYMSKYGPLYVKPENEPEYKDVIV